MTESWFALVSERKQHLILEGHNVSTMLTVQIEENCVHRFVCSEGYCDHDWDCNQLASYSYTNQHSEQCVRHKGLGLGLLPHWVTFHQRILCLLWFENCSHPSCYFNKISINCSAIACNCWKGEWKFWNNHKALWLHFVMDWEGKGEKLEEHDKKNRSS